jgi:L-aspartate oxidase
VLATGGYAALYPETSNHAGARGEGIVLAARIGAAVADLEFVQFHPTVLAGTGFLISEALRGAGAVLRDETGARFMLNEHEAAELAPRDIVSRAVHRSMRASGAAQVWLDATGIEREGGRGTLGRRFPAISQAVRARGIEWGREAVPVAPAAHYTMGGVVTDLDGRTSMPGLFAVGEVACTGVHGANRLASNSLLEGLVFGPRAATAAADYTAGAGRGSWLLRGAGAAGLIAKAETLAASTPEPVASAHEPAALAHKFVSSIPGLVRSVPGLALSAPELVEGPDYDRALGAVVAGGLGIERDAEGLRAVGSFAAAHSGAGAELAAMIARSALARTESRGAHQRADFAAADPAQAVRRAWVVAGPAAGAIPREETNATNTTTEALGAAATGGSLIC